MIAGYEFLPQWASPPGDTISELISARGLTLSSVEEALKKPKGEINALLQGDVRIDLEIAEVLSEFLGGSTDFWIERDQQFVRDMARLNSRRQYGSDESWVKNMPVREMERMGWIEPTTIGDRKETLLNYFGVESVDSWLKEYEQMVQAAAFRTSASFSENSGSVAAWLRKGQLEAEKIKCADWDPKALRCALPEARRLTRESNPEVFLPKLRRICSECGVALVIVKTPAGCRASGATLFLSLRKAMILLSFRYLTDDHFWFSFFHECGHLLLHDSEMLFLEGKSAANDQKESEANHFAGDVLIPPEFSEELLATPPRLTSIVRFARKIGVSRGIIVGQMQHLGLIGFDVLNNLKVRYSWVRR